MIVSSRQSVGGVPGVRVNTGPRVQRITYGNLAKGLSQAQEAPHSGKRRASVAAIAGKVILAFIAIGAAVYLVPRPVARTVTTIPTQDVKPPTPVVAGPAGAPVVPTQQQKAAAFLAAMPIAAANTSDAPRDATASDSVAANTNAPALAIVPLPRPRPQPR